MTRRQILKTNVMFQQRRRAHCAQTKRLGMCLFARANLTHRCLLKAPRFPYCLPLVQNSSPSVQVSSSPLIASATLHHPQTWQQNMFVLELLSFLCGCPIPHPPHVRFFSSLIIITVGFYRRDRQIMGVVSTLQLRAVIHTNFFHNHRHWQSPLILLITTILSSKPSSSERTYCTST